MAGRTIAGLVLGALLAGAAPATAGIWTPVASGVTDTITAVDYQGPDRFWYVTDTGGLRYREAGTFRTGAAPSLSGTALTDVAFQPGTPVGIAVGTGGHLWRTVNGGRDWARVTFTHLTSPCGATGIVPQPQADPPVTLLTVAWGPGSVVYAGGEDRTLLRSGNAGAAWTEINKRRLTGPLRIACRLDQDVSDLQPLLTPADGSALRFIARNGVVYATADGLQSDPVPQVSLGCPGTGRPSLAIDLLSPMRQWAATSGVIGCLALTADGATRRDPVVMGAGTLAELKAVDAAGAPPTVVVVGREGGVHTSVDGTSFYPQPAEGALATAQWQAVSGYDAENFALGGEGGALAVAEQASLIPDVFAPEGEIEGPAAVTIGVPTTFVGRVTDNEGGSGVDPDRLTWRATGQEERTGPSVTYAFPEYGTYEIVLDFRDRAGNRGSTKRLVTVVAPPTVPGVLPEGMLLQPRRSAVRRGRRATVSIRGSLRAPAGVAAARACTGTVGLTLLRGTRSLGYRRAALTRACAYAGRFRLAAARVRGARTLSIRVRFFGNPSVAGTTRTFTAKVRIAKRKRARRR